MMASNTKGISLSSWESALGSLLVTTGLVLAILGHSPVWYPLFGPGGLIFLDGINSRHGFSVLRHPKTALMVWVGLMIAACMIELVAARGLQIVYYPHLSVSEYIVHTLIIGYPSAALFALEVLVFLDLKVTQHFPRLLLFALGMLTFCVTTEFPNTFAWEWAYHITCYGQWLGIPRILFIVYPFLIPILYLKPLFRTT